MKNKVIAALVISIGLISIVGGCSSPSSRLKSMKNDATERLKKETQDSTLEESSFDSEIEANNHNSKPEIIPVSSGNDLFGSLNGVGFKEANNSWSDTFAKDGWVLNTDNDGEYCFATARNNDKYGTDIELYLYNGMSDDNVFVEEIESNGFSGYGINVCYAESYPSMSWNGITFGATDAEVKAAYGKPSHVYEGRRYTEYTYDLSDNTEIEFEVYNDGGLLGVNLIILDN